MVDPKRKLVGWKIYYMDGTILSSRHHKWIECKQTEIEVVKLFYINSDGSKDVNVHHGQEYYLLNDLDAEKIPKEIKIGKAMDGEKFWEMYDKATKTDIEFVDVMI